MANRKRKTKRGKRSTRGALSKSIGGDGATIAQEVAGVKIERWRVRERHKDGRGVEVSIQVRDAQGRRREIYLGMGL